MKKKRNFRPLAGVAFVAALSTGFIIASSHTSNYNTVWAAPVDPTPLSNIDPVTGEVYRSEKTIQNDITNVTNEELIPARQKIIEEVKKRDDLKKSLDEQTRKLQDLRPQVTQTQEEINNAEAKYKDLMGEINILTRKLPSEQALLNGIENRLAALEDKAKSGTITEKEKKELDDLKAQLPRQQAIVNNKTLELRQKSTDKKTLKFK